MTTENIDDFIVSKCNKMKSVLREIVDAENISKINDGNLDISKKNIERFHLFLLFGGSAEKMYNMCLSYLSIKETNDNREKLAKVKLYFEAIFDLLVEKIKMNINETP